MLDYNGTLACDGCLLPGVTEALQHIAKDLEIHVVTGNTYGDAELHLKKLPCTFELLPPGAGQDVLKLQYLQRLGPAQPRASATVATTDSWWRRLPSASLSFKRRELPLRLCVSPKSFVLISSQLCVS